MDELLQDLKEALEDVLAEDDNGDVTSTPKYQDLEIVDGDTLCVQTHDGHRYFIEVQQHD